MSFLRLAEAEVKITQAMLLSNLFPEEEPEEIVEPELPAVIDTPAVETPAASNIIALPANTSVQLDTTATYQICTTQSGIYVVDGSIGPNDTQTNRIWHIARSSTATSNTACWHTPNSTDINITRTSTTATTGGIYTNRSDTYFYYTGSATTPVFVTGNIAQCYGEYKPPPPKPVGKAAKSSIKRAIKLLDNFGMEKDTKIFLSGDEIEVSHPDSLFKFVITKRDYSNILRNAERPPASVPFKLELFTKTGLHIANLCVYAEDTPMLDNLFMVAMFVKTGNEEDLLRKANFFSITQDSALKELIVSEVDYLEPKLLPYRNRERRNTGIYLNPGRIEGNAINSTVL